MEDFLSEGIAELVRRLPRQAQSEFIGQQFVPKALEQEWIDLDEKTDHFRIETQYSFSDGRFDLIVFADNEPIIVIENKVEAPIGRRSQDDDQLKRYGSWLKQNKNAGWPGVLCLLTHITAPPVHFVESKSGSYGVGTTVSAWSEVAQAVKRLSDCARSGDASLATTKFFADEFYAFLMEQGMTGEYAALQDFSAAFIYLNAHEKLEHTFGVIDEHLNTLGGVFPEGQSKYDESLWYGSSAKLIWGWRIFRSKLSDLYFGYGIALMPQMHIQGNRIPMGDAVFLCVGTENRTEAEILRREAPHIDQAWTCVSFGETVALAKFKPLADFISTPEQFAPKMIDWINVEKQDVQEFVMGLKKTS